MLALSVKEGPPLAGHSRTATRQLLVQGAEWALIEAVLPMVPGRPTVHHPRLVINTILFLMRSDPGLRTVPPWSTAESYYWLWQADGTWSKIMAALQAGRVGTTLAPDISLRQRKRESARNRKIRWFANRAALTTRALLRC